MVREINLYSLNSKLAYIHPVEKLSLVVISLLCCSYTKNSYIIIANIALFIILNILAKNPLKVINKFLCITGTFFLFTLITLLWQNTSLEYIVLLFLRVINGSVTIAFLALTTPINHLVYLFNKKEVLRDVGDIIKCMERFLIVIEDDFFMTFNAMKCRGGFGGVKNSIKDFGTACGITFKNLLLRWKEINTSMKNRCYRGKFNYAYNFKFSPQRLSLIFVYLLICIGVNILTP